MWISRKKWNALNKRIADLEAQAKSQQLDIISLKYPYAALKKTFAEHDH